MSQDADRRALLLGVAALQDYVDQAHRNPLRGTLQLRSLLALLALHSQGDEEAYRLFWTRCRRPLDPDNVYTDPQNYERGTMTQTAWAKIVRDLGFKERQLEFHRTIQEMVRDARRRGSPALRDVSKPRRDCGWVQ